MTPARKTVTVHPAPVTFLGLLTLLFIGAKLFGAIAWSWVWVLSPLWIPVAIAAVVFVVAPGVLVLVKK